MSTTQYTNRIYERSFVGGAPLISAVDMHRLLIFFAFAFLCGCASQPNNLGSGSVLDEELLVFKSSAGIEEKLYFVEKHEVVAGSAHFLFYTRYPYRGIPSTGVYCYEQIKPDKWLLRGFFPIIVWNFEDLTDERVIKYVTEGESVNVVCNERVLFSIKSLALSVRKSE